MIMQKLASEISETLEGRINVSVLLYTTNKGIFTNSLIEVYLINEELHIFNVCNLMSLDVC